MIQILLSGLLPSWIILKVWGFGGRLGGFVSLGQFSFESLFISKLKKISHLHVTTISDFKTKQNQTQ